LSEDPVGSFEIRVGHAVAQWLENGRSMVGVGRLT
jgi:hypothetical protein